MTVKRYNGNMKTFNIPAVPVHPGEILQSEFLEPMGLSQTALAEHLKIPLRRVNEICRGRRAITPETAWLLSQAFGTTPQFWLNGQMIFDLATARQEKKFRKVTRIKAAS
jgi:addiction module HigA family antidote